MPADRRAFGLAVVTFGSAIGPAIFAPPLTFLIVVVGWRSAFALLGGIALIAFSALADRVFRRTGSHRRSYVYAVTAVLIVSALSLYLAVNIPSSLGAVIFFTLALIGVAVPMVSTIIAAVAPAAHRGTVLGTVVAVASLPGIIAPLVTGLIIQAAGKNMVLGFHHAYLLASLFLLIGGVAFLAFARPDDEQLAE